MLTNHSADRCGRFYLFQKLSDLQFQRLVNLALIVSGIALALK